jgi:hypothetical protein
MIVILTVSAGKETDLELAGIAAAAICGGGVTQPFPPPKQGDPPLPARPAPVGGGGIEVQADVDNAPFAKAAFVAVGFYVRTATGPLKPPVKPNLTILNVTPMLPDDKYPVGAETTGRVAATALCGACVTQPFPEGGDPYSGDPAQSMQVSCDTDDVPRVAGGFAAVGFKTA